MSDQQRRLEVLRQKLDRHALSFPVKLLFPAKVYGVKRSTEILDQAQAHDGSYQKGDVPLRTDKDFINFRLIESRVHFASANDGDETTSTPLTNLGESLDSFVADLERTGCYESVNVVVGKAKTEEDLAPNSSSSSSSSFQTCQLDVVLEEKNWYKLYIGGGLKQDQNSLLSSSSSLIPKVQFETSASLINLSGRTDVTNLNYAIDQTSTPTISFMHTRPLYSLLGGGLSNAVLNMDQGSRVGVTMKAEIDTYDYEHIRSSRDHVQKVGVKISNTTTGSSTSGDLPACDDVYSGLEWSLALRDVLPRRHTTIPYQYDASPEIIAASGPNLKHSLKADFRLNGNFTDSRFQPSAGIDSYGGIEVAGPPGDVGFAKIWGGSMLHIPIMPLLEDDERQKAPIFGQLLNGLSMHTAFHGGILKPLSFGGLCSTHTTSISDRFYVGGSHQLRGFLPAGIGPRSAKGGASTPGGDSIGGDVFYTASQSISMPFPGNEFLAKNNVRIFGFANAGTLTSFDNAMDFSAFMRSSRVAFGAGVSFGSPIGRLEATYAVPFRYGPHDGRRSVQGGIGVNFG